LIKKYKLFVLLLPGIAGAINTIWFTSGEILGIGVIFMANYLFVKFIDKELD
jgi:hypothetical protein